MLRVAKIAGAMLLAVAFVGCGSGGGSSGSGSSGSGASSAVTNTATVASDTAQQDFAPTIVRDGDILAEPKGSPQRGLLAWWQAFQFQDATTVEKLTSKETLQAVGDKPLAKLVHIRGAGTPGIKILSVSKSGNTASIRVALLTFQPDKQGHPTTTVASSTPNTFDLKNENGTWKFEGTVYLQNLIANS